MKKEMIGLRFGRLSVVSEAPRRGKAIYWRCVCDCGAMTEVYGGSLRAGTSTSCGCKSAKLAAERRKTHGKSKTRTYAVWLGMRKRCNDPHSSAYKNYGGRGIRVCDRWNESFDAFLADMGECKERFSIERIDNDGHYEPKNCKWATHAEQANNRRSCLIFSYQGKTKNLSQWAKELNLDYHLVIKRINFLGWTFEQAITTKKRTHKPQLQATA